MELQGDFDSLQDLYNFNKEVLRPMTFSDYSLEDKELFKEQYDSDRKLVSETDRMMLEDEIFGEVVYLSPELTSFYKI